eukprot:2215889-Rhodomonas_salina.3
MRVFAPAKFTSSTCGKSGGNGLGQAREELRRERGWKLTCLHAQADLASVTTDSLSTQCSEPLRAHWQAAGRCGPGA